MKKRLFGLPRIEGGILMQSRLIFLFVMINLIFGCSTLPVQKEPAEIGSQWHAVHLLDYDTDEKLMELGKNIPKLVSLGINVIVLEVDYNFDYRSHPELRRGDRPVTEKAAHTFAALCWKHGIRKTTRPCGPRLNLTFRRILVA